MKKWFLSLPMFWQVYLFIVFVLVSIVGVTELVLEPLMEYKFLGILDTSVDLYEIPVWMVSILVPSLACGYIFSRILTSRLKGMAATASAIAHGDYAARMRSRGNEKNPFNELAEAFNLMADSVERQLSHERRLIVDIGHELRSPLARMAVAVELLERETTPSGQATLLRLEKDIRYVSGLLAAMLSQGRERHLDDAEEEENVLVAPLLAELADDYLFQNAPQGKKLALRCAEGLKTRCGRFAFRHVVGNVLSNALFYTPPGSEVDVTAAREGDWVKIVVRDKGPGVPENLLEDIFRPFFRVDNARVRNIGGAGLGLALARAEATRLGGAIVAENANPGLRVSIYLPSAVGHAADAA
jgi:two-component system sensor histidine kinase CpxA